MGRTKQQAVEEVSRSERIGKQLGLLPPDPEAPKPRGLAAAKNRSPAPDAIPPDASQQAGPSRVSAQKIVHAKTVGRIANKTPRKKPANLKAANRKFATRKTPVVPAIAIPKRPHRFRPGTVALREIRKYQRSTGLLIPRAPFRRLCREISGNTPQHFDRWTPNALESIQEAAEAFLVGFFEDAVCCAIHRKCITVIPKDFNLVKRLRG
jgi:histone H3/H4